MLGWRRPHCFVFLSTFAAQEEVGDGGAHIASAAAAPGGEDGALLRVRGQLLHWRRQHPLVRPRHHRREYSWTPSPLCLHLNPCCFDVWLRIPTADRWGIRVKSCPVPAQPHRDWVCVGRGCLCLLQFCVSPVVPWRWNIISSMRTLADVLVGIWLGLV